MHGPPSGPRSAGHRNLSGDLPWRDPVYSPPRPGNREEHSRVGRPVSHNSNSVPFDSNDFYARRQHKSPLPQWAPLSVGSESPSVASHLTSPHSRPTSVPSTPASRRAGRQHPFQASHRNARGASRSPEGRHGYHSPAEGKYRENRERIGPATEESAPGAFPNDLAKRFTYYAGLTRATSRTSAPATPTLRHPLPPRPSFGLWPHSSWKDSQANARACHGAPCTSLHERSPLAPDVRSANESRLTTTLLTTPIQSLPNARPDGSSTVAKGFAANESVCLPNGNAPLPLLPSKESTSSRRRSENAATADDKTQQAPSTNDGSEHNVGDKDDEKLRTPPQKLPPRSQHVAPLAEVVLIGETASDIDDFSPSTLINTRDVLKRSHSATEGYVANETPPKGPSPSKPRSDPAPKRSRVNISYTTMPRDTLVTKLSFDREGPLPARSVSAHHETTTRETQVVDSRGISGIVPRSSAIPIEVQACGSQDTAHGVHQASTSALSTGSPSLSLVKDGSRTAARTPRESMAAEITATSACFAPSKKVSQDKETRAPKPLSESSNKEEGGEVSGTAKKRPVSWLTVNSLDGAFSVILDPLQKPAPPPSEPQARPRSPSPEWWPPRWNAVTNQRDPKYYHDEDSEDNGDEDEEEGDELASANPSPQTQG